MRKSIILVLTTLFLFSAAIAETDLQSMTVGELTALRQSVDMELAHRIQADETAQTVMVDGLAFQLQQALIGTGEDDKPAIGIVFTVSNTSDATKSMMMDISYNILQGGVGLDTTYFHSDNYNGVSAVDTMYAKIKPGAVNQQLCIAGLLSGDDNRIEVDLFRKQAPRGEEPYCGTFVIDLAELK